MPMIEKSAVDKELLSGAIAVGDGDGDGDGDGEGAARDDEDPGAGVLIFFGFRQFNSFKSFP